MAAWGKDSCSNDSCWDNLYARNIHNMSQKEANDTVSKLYGANEYRKGEAAEADKHGVAIWILSQGKRVDIKVLKEVLVIAKKRSKINHIVKKEGWRNPELRQSIVEEEIEVIEAAIENEGKGKKRYIEGLLDKMEKLLEE